VLSEVRKRKSRPMGGSCNLTVILTYLNISFSPRAQKTGLEVVQAFQETGNMAKVLCHRNIICN
jgi:hypothetical protein